MHMPGELWQPSPGIAAPPAAQVTYRGGPLLTAVKVFTIFWGQAWKTSPASALPDQINQFFKFVLSSSLIDQLSEYSVAGKNIGHGSFIDTLTIISPALSHSITDTAIQAALQQEIKSGAVPKPDANTSLLHLPCPGNRGRAGRLTFLPGILRLPRHLRERNLLRRDALPELFRLPWRTDQS